MRGGIAARNTTDCVTLRIGVHVLNAAINQLSQQLMQFGTKMCISESQTEGNCLGQVLRGTTWGHASVEAVYAPVDFAGSVSPPPERVHDNSIAIGVHERFPQRRQKGSLEPKHCCFL